MYWRGEKLGVDMSTVETWERVISDSLFHYT